MRLLLLRRPNLISISVDNLGWKTFFIKKSYMARLRPEVLTSTSTYTICDIKGIHLIENGTLFYPYGRDIVSPLRSVGLF